MLDIFAVPNILESLGFLGNLGTLEPWKLSGILRTLGALRNSWEPGTLQNLLEPGHPVAHVTFGAMDGSNPIRTIAFELLRLAYWGKITVLKFSKTNMENNNSFTIF